MLHMTEASEGILKAVEDPTRPQGWLEGARAALRESPVHRTGATAEKECSRIDCRQQDYR